MNKMQRILVVFAIQGLILLFTAHLSNYEISSGIYWSVVILPLVIYFLYLPYINNEIIVFVIGGSLNPKDNIDKVLIYLYLTTTSIFISIIIFDFQPELFREFLYGKDYE